MKRRTMMVKRILAFALCLNMTMSGSLTALATTVSEVGTEAASPEEMILEDENIKGME